MDCENLGIGMTNKLLFWMFRKGRQILSSFFGPIGLQSFVLRMHETTRAHFEQFFEKKDEIMAGTLLKKFTLYGQLIYSWALNKALNFMH